MKITGPNDIRAADAKRLRKSRSGEGNFESMLDAGEETGAVGTAAPVGLTQSIISLQEVDPDQEKRQKQRQHGEALLDQLDRIRHGLLIGAVDKGGLRRIQEMLAKAKITSNDPYLQNIVQEIEVRAAVELAKLENNL